MLKTQFSEQEESEINFELLSLVAKHNLRATIGSFLALIFLFLITLRQEDLKFNIFVWALLAVVAQINRMSSLFGRFSNSPDYLRFRKKRYLISACFVSATYVLYIVMFFKALDEPERCFMTLLVLGLCSGSVVNNAGLRSGFVCFSIPILVTTVLYWISTDFLSLPKGLDTLMAILIGFYGVVLNEMSKNTYQILLETFSLRFEERKQKSLLSRALEDAELANKTKTRFLAAASHDLRQPLHTISLVSAALDLQQLESDTKKLVNLLNQVSLTLSRQLNDLLDISKLDAGIIAVNLQPANINTLIRNVASEFELELSEKRLNLILNLSSNEDILIDPELMYRLLRNLVHNAIKFTKNGSITLKSYDEGDKVVVEVIDTGCGIPKQFQDEIFQEFYQIDNEARDRTKGFGLGLSIVARLAKLLDIQIQVESSIDKGAKFSLYIPKNAGSSDTNNPLEQEASWTKKTNFQLNVLIIEDDELVKHATVLLLQRLGCTCYAASNTDTASLIARNHKLDLIIADFRLGKDDNGVIAIKAINPDGIIDSVLVTGDTEPDLLREIEASGFRVIHKPVTAEILYSVLKSVHTKKQKVSI